MCSCRRRLGGLTLVTAALKTENHFSRKFGQLSADLALSEGLREEA